MRYGIKYKFPKFLLKIMVFDCKTWKRVNTGLNLKLFYCLLLNLKTNEIRSGQYIQGKIVTFKSVTGVEGKYLCLKPYCAFPVHDNLSWQSKRLFSS